MQSKLNTHLSNLYLKDLLLHQVKGKKKTKHTPPPTPPQDRHEYSLNDQYN